jgi:hypothetical protein
VFANKKFEQQVGKNFAAAFFFCGKLNLKATVEQTRLIY